MTLETELKHLETEEHIKEVITNNENVMICCGRMGPMCVPVYAIMEDFEEDYSNVQFRDMLFDSPEAMLIRNLPECTGFNGLPFTVYYKNGKVVKATSSIQNKNQVKTILDENFSK